MMNNIHNKILKYVNLFSYLAKKSPSKPAIFIRHNRMKNSCCFKLGHQISPIGVSFIKGVYIYRRVQSCLSVEVSRCVSALEIVSLIIRSNNGVHVTHIHHETDSFNESLVVTKIFHQEFNETIQLTEMRRLSGFLKCFCFFIVKHLVTFVSNCYVKAQVIGSRLKSLKIKNSSRLAGGSLFLLQLRP